MESLSENFLTSAHLLLHEQWSHKPIQVLRNASFLQFFFFFKFSCNQGRDTAIHAELSVVMNIGVYIPFYLFEG